MPIITKLVAFLLAFADQLVSKWATFVEAEQYGATCGINQIQVTINPCGDQLINNLYDIINYASFLGAYLLKAVNVVSM